MSPLIDAVVSDIVIPGNVERSFAVAMQHYPSLHDEDGFGATD
jgi:hypothetical protein